MKSKGKRFPVVHVDRECVIQMDMEGNSCEIFLENRPTVSPEFIEDAFKQAGNIW